MVEIFQNDLGYVTNWLWKKCTLRETAQPPFLSLKGLKLQIDNLVYITRPRNKQHSYPKSRQSVLDLAVNVRQPDRRNADHLT